MDPVVQDRSKCRICDRPLEQEPVSYLYNTPICHVCSQGLAGYGRNGKSLGYRIVLVK